MKKVNITLFGAYAYRPVLCVDGKFVKLKKAKNEKLTYTYETEKEKSTVEIFKVLEVNARLYLLTQIFFYLISFFGIFNARLDKKCIVSNVKYEFDLIENTDIKIRLNSPQANATAIKLEANTNFEMINNKFVVDENAKKRLKTLKYIKLGIFFATVITAILLIVLL